MLTIRQEEEKDYAQVYETVRRAFAGAEESDGDEQNLVCRLRKSTAFIPELSLVAETEGKIVGHIMFTRLRIAGTEQLALAPLAVLPEYQKQGIGGKLIESGHQIAKKWDSDFPSFLAILHIIRNSATGRQPGSVSNARSTYPKNALWPQPCKKQTGLKERSFTRRNLISAETSPTAERLF